MRDARDQSLDEVVELAITSAVDLGEAVKNFEAFFRSMRSRLIDIAIQDGPANDLAGSIAAFTCAAIAEAKRWGLPEPRSMPIDATHVEAERIPAPCRPHAVDLERYAHAREGRYTWSPSVKSGRPKMREASFA